MVSRDREIAKTVVYGIRTIISLLREIRDELGARRQYEDEIRALHSRIGDLSDAVARSHSGVGRESRRYTSCDVRGCSLPKGHLGNHRGSIRAVS
jgi:uncharacterized membrane protein